MILQRASLLLTIYQDYYEAAGLLKSCEILNDYMNEEGRIGLNKLKKICVKKATPLCYYIQ